MNTKYKPFFYFNEVQSMRVFCISHFSCIGDQNRKEFAYFMEIRGVYIWHVRLCDTEQLSFIFSILWTVFMVCMWGEYLDTGNKLPILTWTGKGSVLVLVPYDSLINVILLFYIFSTQESHSILYVHNPHIVEIMDSLSLSIHHFVSNWRRSIRRHELTSPTNIQFRIVTLAITAPLDYANHQQQNIYTTLSSSGGWSYLNILSWPK